MEFSTSSMKTQELRNPIQHSELRFVYCITDKFIKTWVAFLTRLNPNYLKKKTSLLCTPQIEKKLKMF